MLIIVLRLTSDWGFSSKANVFGVSFIIDPRGLSCTFHHFYNALACSFCSSFHFA